MNTTKKFHVAHNNQQYGPMTWDDLLRYNFPPNALVWTEGMANWQPLSTMLPRQSSPPPLHTPPVNVNIIQDDDRYANFGLRLAAHLIDSVILYIVGSLILGALLALLLSEMLYRNPGGFMALSYILAIVAVWLYSAIFESSEYQATPGKMILKIKVVDMQHRRISFANASGRLFSKILSGLILGIGYLMVLWAPYKQGLHDQIAQTFVVKKDAIF